MCLWSVDCGDDSFCVFFDAREGPFDSALVSLSATAHSARLRCPDSRAQRDLRPGPARRVRVPVSAGRARGALQPTRSHPDRPPRAAARARRPIQSRRGRSDPISRGVWACRAGRAGGRRVTEQTQGARARWLGAQGACDAGHAPWARARRDGSFMGSFVRCMHTSDIAPGVASNSRLGRKHRTCTCRTKRRTVS